MLSEMIKGQANKTNMEETDTPTQLSPSSSSSLHSLR